MTATATPAGGYTFTSFSGLVTTTTNPYIWTADATGTVTANFVDNTAPVCTITGGTTANLSCTDGAGVVAYYFGTTLNPSAGSYTPVSSTTSWSTTVTPDTIGVYYLYAKDAAGNISTVVSGKYLKVNVEVGVPPCYGEQYIMQDISSWASSLSSETPVTACDKRDDNKYTVAKLLDNKIWMTQNLRFAYSAGDTVEISDGAGGTSTWQPNLGTYTTTGTWAYSTTTPESYYGGDTTNGAYYNWTAALGIEDSSSYTTDGQVANTSICPKGWKLPQNAEGAGSFYTLYQSYNSSALMQGTPGFVLSGYYYGSVDDVGSFGGYRSSTVLSSDGAYYLYLDSSDVDPQYYDDRGDGLSVRCVAI